MANGRSSQRVGPMFVSGDPCLPGDITVTAIERGFMIGRVLSQVGPGPWWQYIGTFDQLQMAVEFAAHANAQAWLHLTDGSFESIPLRSRD